MGVATHERIAASFRFTVTEGGKLRATAGDKQRLPEYDNKQQTNKQLTSNWHRNSTFAFGDIETSYCVQHTFWNIQTLSQKQSS
jgi:hypothetical protein